LERSKRKAVDMLFPSEKSPVVERTLAERFGVSRVEAILNEVCVSAPIGCGQPVEGFRTDLSAREYEISGLCEKCQERYFG